MKYGWNGVSAAMRAAHAPPRPMLTSKSGPKQHAVAPNAASAPATSDAPVLIVANPRKIQG